MSVKFEEFIKETKNNKSSRNLQHKQLLLECLNQVLTFFFFFSESIYRDNLLVGCLAFTYHSTHG